MSWEDCGFKPVNIDPPTCPKGECGDCDGEHHFYVGVREMPNGSEEMVFTCKHCGLEADGEDDYDAGFPDGDDQ